MPARLASAAAIAVGIVLIALAVPRLTGGLFAAGVPDSVRALSRGAVPSPSVLAAATTRARTAADWAPSGDRTTDLGALLLARARADGYASQSGRAFLDRSIAVLRDGLARAPANPVGWTLLAQAELLSGAAPPRIDAAFTMAARTGPHTPRLVLARVETGLAALAALNPTTRALLDRDIRSAARHVPERLARIARTRYALGPVRAALADDKALRRRFDLVYLRQN